MLITGLSNSRETAFVPSKIIVIFTVKIIENDIYHSNIDCTYDILFIENGHNLIRYNHV